jgi:hypothetical protein
MSRQRFVQDAAHVAAHRFAIAFSHDASVDRLGGVLLTARSAPHDIGEWTWQWETEENETFGRYLVSMALPRPSSGVVRVLPSDGGYVANVDLWFRSTPSAPLAEAAVAARVTKVKTAMLTLLNEVGARDIREVENMLPRPDDQPHRNTVYQTRLVKNRSMGLAFRHPGPLAEVFRRVRENSRLDWIERDNDDLGDYLWTKLLTKPSLGTIKVFQSGDQFVANFSAGAIESTDTPCSDDRATAMLADAERALRELINTIGGTDVQEVADYDA